MRITGLKKGAIQYRLRRHEKTLRTGAMKASNKVDIEALEPFTAQDFLVSQATLTIKQRVAQIEKMGVRCTLHSLRKAYRLFGVSYKAVRERRRWRRADDSRNLAKDELVLEALKEKV